MTKIAGFQDAFCETVFGAASNSFELVIHVMSVALYSQLRKMICCQSVFNASK